MRITTEELALFTAACADRNNARAQDVVNVLGTPSAAEIVQLIASLPPEVRRDLEKHVQEAIDEQRRRRHAR